MSTIDWVAEVGSLHKGSPALAYEFIRMFAQAGATTLKFQFGWTKETQEKFGLEYNPIRYVDPMAEDLLRWCDMHGVKLLASIWSEEGLETAQAICMPRYKIAYKMWKQEHEICEKIMTDGVPCYISGERRVPLPHYSVYCVSKYPTYPGEVKLTDNFHGYYGYSDHAHGIAACLLAVSRGARYIEKHVCLDKTDLSTKDSPFSVTPDEFATMVKIGNDMRRHLDAGD